MSMTVIVPVACDDHFVYQLVNADALIVGLYCKDCDAEYLAEE